jgi:hypothetical protein
MMSVCGKWMCMSTKPGARMRPGQVGHGSIGMARRHGGMAAGVEHALAAGAVGGNDQQAVFIENGQAGVVESQEGGAVGFFHRGCGG